LRNHIGAASADVAEKARRKRLLRHLESPDKAHPLELAKYSESELGCLRRWTSNNDIAARFLLATLLDLFEIGRCSKVQAGAC